MSSGKSVNSLLHDGAYVLSYYGAVRSMTERAIMERIGQGSPLRPKATHTREVL